MLPFPLISGGHQALYNGILAIHKDMEVNLSFVVEDEYKYIDALGEFMKELPNVRMFPYYQCRRISNGARRQKESKPWYNKMFHAIFHRKRIKNRRTKYLDKTLYWKQCTLPPSPEWLKHNQDIIDLNKFDIVQIEMPWLMNTVIGIKTDGKIIFVHHELGFVRRALEIQGTSKDDCATWSWCRFADMNEISLLNNYDAIITLSPTDTAKLTEAGVTKPVYSSLAVINTFPERIEKFQTTKRLTFVGPDVHTPNYNAIIWFLENCWTQLREADEEYTLEIVGLWSEYNIKKITSNYYGVSFRGYVDDLSDAIKGSIMIVPIQIGSGIRMKILEASIRGIPFVSTSVGAEGIPVENGVHCFIADEPEVFVQSILKLRDVSLQERFVSNSRKLIQDNFSINSLRTNRLSIYNDICK